MHQAAKSAFYDELTKIAAAKKVKSNDRMTPRTKENVAQIIQSIQELEPKHREEAKAFVEKHSPEVLFDILHGMRRWYSGQTMAKKLIEHNEPLQSVMKLSPEDAVGVYRGFKVSKNNPLAQASIGDRLSLPVTRNRGLSSWSTSETAINRFSGAGKGMIGINVKLVEARGVKPILAPPEHTKPWFNELYTKAIGTSFRPKESEYLLAAPTIQVEVVRVKK